MVGRGRPRVPMFSLTVQYRAKSTAGSGRARVVRRLLPDAGVRRIKEVVDDSARHRDADEDVAFARRSPATGGEEIEREAYDADGEVVVGPGRPGCR